MNSQDTYNEKIEFIDDSERKGNICIGSRSVSESSYLLDVFLKNFDRITKYCPDCLQERIQIFLIDHKALYLYQCNDKTITCFDLSYSSPSVVRLRYELIEYCSIYAFDVGYQNYFIPLVVHL